MSIHTAKDLTIQLGAPYYFEEHGVQGLTVVPGAAYIDFALSTAKQMLPATPTIIRNIRFENGLIIPNHDPSKVCIDVKERHDASWHFTCNSPVSDASSQSIIYAHMVLSTPSGMEVSSSSFLSVGEAQQRCTTEISSTELYKSLRNVGNEYGERYQTIQQLWLGNGEAVGLLRHRLAPPSEDNFTVDPFLLDGCVQLFSSIVEKGNRAYILEQMGELIIHGKPSGICWAVAELTASSHIDGVFSGAVNLFDQEENLIWSLTDIQIQLLSESIPEDESDIFKETTAVTATFTAEPLEDSLLFWSQLLGKSTKVEFAPYNQVFQQLLTPQSLINTNDSGFNVFLIRLEDWGQKPKEIPLRVSSSEKEAILSSHSRHKLRADIEIAHLNQYETEYVYQEIFEDLAYLKHGISINDGDCIIDIGANIGLFTLFVQQQASNTTVYSFEPSPPIFQILSTNAKIYGENVHLFNLGVSDRKADAEFTYYENSSVFSSFSANKEADEHAIRAVIENMVRDNAAIDKEQIDQIVDDLISDRLTSTQYTCQLTSLSDVISENQIEQIDLLKVDAEKSELPILRGIAEEDWQKIKQIVIEVHDQDGPLIKEVTQILRDKGFKLAIEEEEFLQGSGLYNIFAKRPDNLNGSEIAGEKGSGTIQANFTTAVRANVSDLLAALETSSNQRKVPSILTICPPSPAVGNDAMKASFLRQMEEEIKHAAEAIGNVSYLSAAEIHAIYSVDDFYDAERDRLGHIPYTDAYFSALGTAITRRSHALNRPPYKVIVVDSDNTLWKGVCGEDGAQGIEISEPFMALQQFMRQQVNAGMLLCLCSKNVEEDIWAVFDGRSDMILKREDIVAHRINWQPKSQNIRELAQELQLGLDSFIFLDDNPVECAEVRAACPQVLTLQLPANVSEIQRFLLHVWAFDHVNVTSEDKKRTALYRENLEREQYRTSGVSLEGFLESLNLDIDVQEMTSENLERVSQLTYRTNQFNFTTIRRSTSEIQQVCDSQQISCLTTTVTDRFGDYGLVGVILYKIVSNSLLVDTFLLSCRVLGRGVEHKMVATLGRIAQERGLATIEMPFVPTPKNQPAVDFLESIAHQYKSKNGDNALYSLPTSIAPTIAYKPTIDREYAEAAMLRSATSKPSISANDASNLTFDSGQKAQQIATELNSSESILARLIAQPARKLRPNSDTTYVAPTNELQGAIVDIWQRILGIQQVGIHDNFFEIGGSSLKGVQLIAQLKQHLDVNLGIVDLFAAPTVSTMTNLIDQQRSGTVVVSAETKESESRGAKRRERMRARR